MPFPVRSARRGRPRHHHRRSTQLPDTQLPNARLPDTQEAPTTHPTDAPRPHHAPHPTHAPPSARPPSAHPLRRLRYSLPAVIVLVAGLTVLFAPPASAEVIGAATSLSGLISNLTGWLVGLLAGLATLFLTIGGVRYLAAGGDPGQVEKAKTALKSAAVGYALAALAPLLVSILASLVA